ncbi:unnamed protein product [Cuscuta campestris]|uniref:Uncharacterized protein n=1 Tax=Cuscuta campestris TaxID=132261 RepID=A0A484MVJ0_9ASTE|nr:unnamed protein product [Cuscuta campestris]
MLHASFLRFFLEIAQNPPKKPNLPFYAFSVFFASPCPNRLIFRIYTNRRFFKEGKIPYNRHQRTAMRRYRDVEEITTFGQRNSGVTAQRQPLKWTSDDITSSEETEFLDTT